VTIVSSSRNRSVSQRIEKGTHFVVNVRGVPDDEGRRHGPRDDGTDGGACAGLRAAGAALAPSFHRLAHRFLVSRAGLALALRLGARRILRRAALCFGITLAATLAIRGPTALALFLRRGASLR
jgi:hypothetical protein